MNDLISSETVRALLLAEGGEDATSSPARVASAAQQVWARIAQRFGMLIGEDGMRAVQNRSVAIAAARVPWLAASAGAGASLQTSLEAQSVADALAGFAELLASLVALLGRFIGPGLVGRVMSDLWPGVFSRDEKELV